MISETASAFGILKTAAETVKTLADIKDKSKLREKTIELQGQIIDAQQKVLAAQDRENALREQVKALSAKIEVLDGWHAERQLYELLSLQSGATVYVRKAHAQPHEAPHWLCATCFDGKKKSFLQFSTRHQHDNIFRCTTCKGHIATHWSETPDSVAKKVSEQLTSSVPCPYCTAKTRLINERDHPHLGPVGVKEHELKCISCERTFERMFADGCYQ